MSSTTLFKLIKIVYLTVSSFSVIVISVLLYTVAAALFAANRNGWHEMDLINMSLATVFILVTMVIGLAAAIKECFWLSLTYTSLMAFFTCFFLYMAAWPLIAFGAASVLIGGSFIVSMPELDHDGKLLA